MFEWPTRQRPQLDPQQIGALDFKQKVREPQLQRDDVTIEGLTSTTWEATMHWSTKAFIFFTLVASSAYATRLYFLPDVLFETFGDSLQLPWPVTLAFLFASYEYVFGICAVIVAINGVMRKFGFRSRVEV